MIAKTSTKNGEDSTNMNSDNILKDESRLMYKGCVIGIGCGGV